MENINKFYIIRKLTVTCPEKASVILEIKLRNCYNWSTKPGKDVPFMKELLYAGVGLISKIHGMIMQLNNAFEANLSDKDLHFLVMGLFGMGMIFVIYPLFAYLAKKNRVMTIAWIYVFTVIVGLSFAIEIGQKVTHTGNMEFADIMYGLVGFLFMFLVFSLLRALYHGILRLIRHFGSEKQGHYEQ